MNTANSIQAWTDRLPQRPEVFPHQLNLVNDSLLLAELSMAELSAASFLDQRVLKQSTKAAWVPWRVVADEIQKMPTGKPASFIFHVGHCGSTLVSRLLEFAQGTRCLREPLPLRTLAKDLADDGDGRSFLSRQALLERLRILSRMWGRGAAHTVIKATSICTDLLTPINSVEPETKFVFIYNRPETHIATLLAGQNALTDLKGFAQLRLQRVQQITGLDIQLNQLSLGQLAALSWASETTRATRFIEKHAQQITLLEFESFLADPTASLTQVLSHLDIPADAQAIKKAVSSPVLQTYSKAPEHKYNAKTRANILADSRSRYSQDINEALGWLESLAADSGLISASLKKFKY
jgi:hypothetical protein